MGWATDLQDASFRGVLFECAATGTTGSKTLAVKQAPYSNVASIEDMGNDPDKISLNAVFSGENYKIELDALIAAIKITGPGELVHPIDGVMQVYVETFTVNHDADNTDYCTVSLEFINAEDKKRELFIPVKTPVAIDTPSIVEAPASRLQTVLDKLKLSDSDQLFNTVTSIRNGVNQAREFLGVAKKAIEDVLSPVSWVVGLVDDVTNLATFDTNISAISKWRDVIHRIQRFKKVFQNDDDSPELKQLWRATVVASHIAVTQQVIATVRKEMVNNETISFTPVDLAVVRQNTRKVLQQTIHNERVDSNFESIAQIQIYKELADQVHLQIQELIETRPPISTVQIPVPCTVHWLAHYLYGDMNRADEIIRLNPDLMNPALLQVGMELTVYAR
ncbi:prophage DNA circulation protein [Acinetobacter calcoaceticus]|uniref:Prophage DNA circulation protein n=1 Tax=Acinetobacter calcoaceticus TaxID=471 RepID=A0A4R1XFK7_ACICA|nr:prophage DNA circulation protein [Acinetobacter calcoaceticus]